MSDGDGRLLVRAAGLASALACAAVTACGSGGGPSRPEGGPGIFLDGGMAEPDAPATGPAAQCGNGVRDPGEACEGAVGCAAGTRCSASCTCEATKTEPSTAQRLI